MANVLTRAFSSAGATTKKFVMAFGSAWGTVWSTGGTSFGWGRDWMRRLGGTSYDYASTVRPTENSVVVACVLWICRTFPEAPIQVLEDQPDDTQEAVRRHPMTELLKRPNDYYSGILLWYATLCDWLVYGNAYWIKVRSGSGRPVQLWWVPQHMMLPRWPDDGSQFLSYYDYYPNAGNPQRIEVQDVVHFRYGMDPDNVRKGLSPLASLLREIFTDDEAANFTASLLRNMGVPSVVLAPDDDVPMGSVGVDDLERVKSDFMTRFGGDRRGEPMVMSGKTKVTVLTFNPQQMDLKSLRRIPEERVSAIFGVPAIVAGLGAGLDRSTFANYAEAREAAYESNIIPTQALLAAELDIQLLPDFADPHSSQVGFDLSKVRVLQADQDKLHERARLDLTAGLISRNRALQMIGEESEGTYGEVLYIPNTVTPSKPDELILPPAPALPLAPAPVGGGALPVPDVAPPNGKVPAALTAGEQPGELKAAWSSSYVSSLPDSAFALVYTDSEGDKQRKLPHHDKGGSLDMSHLRNALSRAPQMTGVTDAQRSRAIAHLQHHMDKSDDVLHMLVLAHEAEHSTVTA